MGFGKVVL